MNKQINLNGYLVFGCVTLAMILLTGLFMAGAHAVLNWKAM